MTDKEREFEKMVYELYGLTDEEVRIVERGDVIAKARSVSLKQSPKNDEEVTWRLLHP